MKRSKKQHHQQLHSTTGSTYSPVHNEDDESNNLYDTNQPLVELALSDQKLSILVDDTDDSTSSTTDYLDDDDDDDHIPYSISSTQKQYAQTLKQIMEQELEEPEFGCMMDKIIRMLIYLAQEDDDVNDINSAIRYLKTYSVQDAITDIGGQNEKLATDFTDSFTERHENAAMEIMLEICIKILNMRKLISDYPMIFVPISFQLYQPRFMTKKSERKHKLKKYQKQRQRRKSSQIAGVVPTYNNYMDNNDINEEENSISTLSREHVEELRDENINNKFKNNNIKHQQDKTMSINEDEEVIKQTKSLPIQNNREMLKQKNSQKRSKTRS